MALFAADVALAQSTNWTGSVSSDWNDAANWSAGLPNSSTRATISPDAPGSGGGPRQPDPLPNQQIVVGGTAEAGSVFLGSLAGSELVVRNGGQMTASGGVAVGANNNNNAVNNRLTEQSGVLRISGNGTRFSTAEGVLLGYFGEGTLSVLDGASFSAEQAITMSPFAGGVSTMTFDGSGTTGTFARSVSAGVSGTANVFVTNGARITSQAVNIGQDGSGSFTIDGTGSSWEITANNLQVGDRGQGTINIRNGGTMRVANRMTLAGRSGSMGTVTIDGAGSALIGNELLNLGDKSNGSIAVTNGGRLETAHVMLLGWNAGGRGVLDASGADSRIVVGGTYFMAGFNGDAEVTLSDGATLEGNGSSDPALIIAHGAGSQATFNIGAARGQQARAAGHVNLARTSFSAGDGELVFNHTTSDYAYTSDISGRGLITHLAGDTTLTGEVSMSGATEMHGGSLILANNASAIGDVSVTGGRFGGVGSVGTLSIGSGATYAPGSATGTQSATSATFDANSTFSVAVDSQGNSGRLDVTGSAALNGATLAVTAANGTDDGSTHSDLTRYTVLSAAGGVSGRFGSVTEDFAFLSATLQYDTDDVTLILLKDGTLDNRASTPNQKSVAQVIESFGSGTLYNAVVGMSDGETDQAFEDLSGGVHASMYAAGLQHAALPRNTVLNRIRFTDGGVGAAPTPVLGYAADEPSSVLSSHGGAFNALENSDLRPYKIWSNVFGTWTNQKGDGNGPGVTATAAGLMIGADTAVGDHWRLGVSAGVGRDWFESDDANASGTNTNLYAGVYGGRSFGDIRFRAGLSHTFTFFDTTRTVSFTGFSERLAADYQGGTTQGYVEAGWVHRFDNVEVEPFAAMALVHQHTDGFSETGGTAALSTDSSNLTQAESTIGLRVAHAFEVGSLSGSIGADAGWRHTYGDLASDLSMRFSTGNSFAVVGNSADRNAALVGLDIDMNVTETGVLQLTYDAELGERVTSQTVRGGLSFRF